MLFLAMQLLKAVLKTLTPNEADVLAKVDRVVKKLNNELKRQKIRARAVAGGSIAKGTFLKDDHDCDIFVKFDYFYKFHDISKVLEVILRRSFRNVAVIHGSRDYFEVPGELRFEIVPVLDIYDPNNAVNVTDCSPLHVQWVQKYPNIKQEIRLSKAFAKAGSLYGAESYIGGFSGHVLDILTIHYNGFLPLLKASQKWKYGDIIDHNKVYATREQALSVLTEPKTQSALIVIDPVQPLRNAAAALTKEKFDQFREKARAFLKHPAKEAFIKKLFSIDEVKARARKNTLFVLSAVLHDGRKDVQGARVVKCLEQVRDALQSHGFEVLESGWDWQPGKPQATVYLIVPPALLSEDVVLPGPPTKQRDHVKMFKEKHQDVFERRGRFYAREQRPFRNSVQLVNHVLRDPMLLERVAKATLAVVNPPAEEAKPKPMLLPPVKAKQAAAKPKKKTAAKNVKKAARGKASHKRSVFSRLVKRARRHSRKKKK